MASGSRVRDATSGEAGKSVIAKASCGSSGSRDARRPSIPLFKTRSLAFKVFAVALAPLLYGLVTGIALAASAAAYWVLIAIGAVGAISSGYEHDEPIAAMCRGSLSAALFTAGLFGALWIEGSAPRAALPAPAVFISINCIAGALICAAGASWRYRAERSASARMRRAERLAR